MDNQTISTSVAASTPQSRVLVQSVRWIRMEHLDDNSPPPFTPGRGEAKKCIFGKPRNGSRKWLSEGINFFYWVAYCSDLNFEAVSMVSALFSFKSTFGFV